MSSRPDTPQPDPDTPQPDSARRDREFATEVVQTLQSHGFTAMLAGGCVRDFLLDRDPKDYDVATDARPEDVRRIFGRRRTLAVGASFGVIIVQAPKPVADVEVATFRTEGPYRDGRRPEHVRYATPEEDAQRRDFTINGMFYDPIDQRIHDYVGGETDLGRGIVRAIGVPQERMSEDKLRMLRAVRFTANLDFELDSATAEAIRGMTEEIRIVSAERIGQEFRKMLVDPHRQRAMKLCSEVGLLPVVLPELRPLLDPEATDVWERTLHRLHLLRDPSFALAAAVLLLGLVEEKTAPSGVLQKAVETAQRFSERLRLSNQEREHIGFLLSHHRALDEADRLPLCRLKPLLAEPLIKDLLALVRIRLLSEGAELHQVLFCEEYLRRTPREILDPPPLVTGHDLIGQGFRPGKTFKTILQRVRDAQLDGEIATPADALALIRREFEPPGKTT